MTEQNRNTKIPAPIYAAAGAGDLAYRQLRKLPTVVNEISERAVAGGLELRERAVASLRVANTTAGALREKANATELEQLRTTAKRSTADLAQAAQERAAALYTFLIARGERVVGTGVVQAAETVNADMEATEAPAAVTASASNGAQADKKQPAKRTKSAAK